MAVVGEPMEEYVLTQVQARQKFAGKLNRDNDHHKFTTSRTAWIKLASGVTLKSEVNGKKGSKFGGGLTYPEKYVLFNGTSTKGTTLRKGIGPEKSYDTSDKDFGVVPMAGIINASIKALNRGSIKKATIKIKANSRRQFEILDELYLRVGYNMLLEWGHTHWLDGDVSGGFTYDMMGSTLIETDWFKSEEYPGSTEEWLRMIRDKRHEYQGNYDAMFGRVVNFTWDFNDDGTYDIELFLISHGDIIESLRTLPSSNSRPSYTNTTTKPCFKVFWDDVASKILKFSKSKPILGDYIQYYWEEPLEWEGYVLDTSPIRDKLTEYLYSVAFFGTGIVSNIYKYTITGNSTPEFKMLPWYIGSYTAAGGNTETYEYTLGVYGGSLTMPSSRVGYHYPYVTNRYYTIGGLKGLFSHSTDVLSGNKKEIVESLIAFDGGFHGMNTTGNNKNNPSMGDFPDKEGGRNAIGKNYSPIDDPNQRSYIRLGNLLEAIQLFCIPYEEENENPIVSIETDKVIPMYVPPEKHGYEQKNKCTFHSAKPKTVIGSRSEINFVYYDPGMTDSSGNFNANYDTQNFNLQIHTAGEECMENLPLVPGGKNYCYVRAENLYISIPYLLGMVPLTKNDGNDVRLNLYSFLKDICQEINQAFGGVNNLEPVLDENTNILRLQDSTNFPYRKLLYETLKISRYDENGEDNYMGSLPDESSFQPFQVYGYRNINGPVASFVRKINLQTKISKELATLSVIGSTANGNTPGLDATALSRFNVGKINRFAKKYDYNFNEDVITPVPFYKQFGYLLYQSGNDPTYPDCSTMLGYESFSLNNSNQTDTTGTLPLLNGKGLMMSDGVQSSNIILFHNFWNENLGIMYKDTEAGSPAIGFLPFEFSLDMDGLSGIKIYNKINVDTSFLPYYYSKSMEFIIKGVEHKLSNNDWVTTIQTISVPKTADVSVPTSTGVNVGASGASPSGGGTPPNPNTIIKWKVDNLAAHAGNSAMNTSSKPGYRNRNIRTIELIDQMKSQGVTNPVAIVAWLSVCAKESGINDKGIKGEKMHHSSGPDSLRAKWFWEEFAAISKIYKNMLGSSTTKTSTAYITKFTDIYKNNPMRIWDQIYGNEAFDVGEHTWNKTSTGDDPPVPGDGYTYRGRGYNQTTFKEGYEKYGISNGDKNLYIAKRKGVSVGGDPTLLGKQPYAKIASATAFISRMTDSNAKPRNGVLAKDYNSWTEADIMSGIELCAWANAGWGKTWSKASGHATDAISKYNQYMFGLTWE